MKGTALSVLRPSGKAKFAEQIVDVVTEGEFISSGTPISIVQADPTARGRARGLDEPPLTAGDNTDQFDLVAFSESSLGPFTAMQGETVVLDQQCWRR